MGLVAAMGALATVAGASEDIDSDIGSQATPIRKFNWLPR